jgi:hypothetical protein
VAGSGAGLSATTDSSCIGCGGYALYGVAGPTEIRVSKAGCSTRTMTLTVTEHQSFHVELIPISAPSDFSGAYRLIITAADECRAALPAEVWERSYAATVTRDGRKLSVTLDGPAIEVDFGGNGPSIMQRLASSPFKLAISGSIVVAPGASPSGTLNGALRLVEIVGNQVNVRGECRAGAHRVVFQQ